MSNPDDPESIDALSDEFLQRNKVSQIQILLAAVKKHTAQTEEAVLKIEYVKKLYAVNLQKLVAASRSLKEKDIELEIKGTEI